jgi:hypothetical protein
VPVDEPSIDLCMYDIELASTGLRCFANEETRSTLAGGPGLNNEHVAEVSAWHSNLSKETRRMLSKWSELQG